VCTCRAVLSACAAASVIAARLPWVGLRPLAGVLDGLALVLVA
jgi:hypothetical protein